MYDPWIFQTGCLSFVCSTLVLYYCRLSCEPSHHVAHPVSKFARPIATSCSCATYSSSVLRCKTRSELRYLDPFGT